MLARGIHSGTEGMQAKEDGCNRAAEELAPAKASKQSLQHDRHLRTLLAMLLCACSTASRSECKDDAFRTEQ